MTLMNRTLSLLASSLLAACATTPVDDDLTACTGKCDGPGGLDPARPDEAALLRMVAWAGRDNQIDAREAADLAVFAKAATGRNARIDAALTKLVETDDRLTPDAVDVLSRAASSERPGDVPLVNAVYRLVPGPSVFLEDDALYLVGDGRVSADTGIRSHSRGYAAKRDGVLFTRHGSLAPAHPAVATQAETAALRTQGPDAALDKAAVIGGVKLSQFTTFSAIAKSPAYYDTSSATPDWAGICQGWTHNALDNRIDLLVDPAGTDGARGVWIFGQWISRADLGNAMMGASFGLGIADSVTIDSFVKPDKLVKALAQHVLRSGIGLRVDIWNDAHNPNGTYDPQIWNQPIVGAEIEVGPVSATAAAAVLGYAMRDSRVASLLSANPAVKLVRARARWGAETSDAWEAEARFRTSEWNMYFVTAADGRVVASYMAYDLAAANVAGLPITRSDGLPDYMAIPKHELTDAALAKAPHRLLDPSNHDGVRFAFLVGTVLARGIPEPTRAAFEAEATGANVDATALAARYPGIANAYTPEQWQRVFAGRLGPGEKFGAVWTR